MKGNNKAKELSLLAKGKIAFEKLEKREQNLLIFLVPTTIIVVFFLLLIEPEFNKSSRLADSVSRLESQLALSRQSNLELLQQAKIDPDIAVSQQIEGLQKSLAKLGDRPSDASLEIAFARLPQGHILQTKMSRRDNRLSSISTISPF